MSEANGTATPAAPESLKVYYFHGVDLTPARGKRGEWSAECPQCGKGGEGRFLINEQRCTYNCVACGFRGNPVEFVRWLHAASLEATTEAQYRELAKERGLRRWETLRDWGLAVSLLTGSWLVPGYSADGRVTTLYKYESPDGVSKRTMMTCPKFEGGGGHGLFGRNLYAEGKPEVHHLEGVWDAMAWAEVLAETKYTPAGELVPTADRANAALSRVNVLASGGASIFFRAWLPLFAGKEVCLFRDNDHEGVNKQTGKPREGAGLQGLKTASALLSAGDPPPGSVRALRWGAAPGEWWTKDLKDGMDVRDLLSGATTSAARASAATDIVRRLTPIPPEWVPGRDPSAPEGSAALSLLPCTTWRELTTACRLAVNFNEGMDRGLSFIYAIIISTRQRGDQLWGKLISPPSSGKTVLCEAISTNLKYIYPVSKMKGFHSGYNDGTGRDHSPLRKFQDKTLVIKDGDTLLSSGNLLEILGEARDVYDRVSRSSYKTGQEETHSGLNMTWLLAGTERLREIDSSDLGERFIDCVMMDDIDLDEERSTALRAAYAACREVSLAVDGTPESLDRPEITRMKQLAGGYVAYLRENAERLLAAVPDEPEVMERCTDLGLFVAYLRARPSKEDTEKDTRELCYRLTKQIVRLAKCLTVVINRERMSDPEVMRRVTRCAEDTARGVTLEITRVLYTRGREGCSVAEVSTRTGRTEHQDREMLRFMKRIGAAEAFDRWQLETDLFGNKRRVGSPRRCWRLTQHFHDLYARVVNPVPESQETDPSEEVVSDE